MPSDCTFFNLHVAIQNAMGWTDSHLHSFSVAQKGTARPIVIQFPDPENDPMFGDDSLDERMEIISNYLGQAVKQFKYTYDFGDNWDHTILLEQILPRDSSAAYPQCVAGANACPPEDCGSVWGYKDLQKILKNPKHPEHKDMLDWLGLDKPTQFDPAEFNASKVAFESAKKRLREYERDFGIKPLSESSESNDSGFSRQRGEEENKIAHEAKELAKKKLPKKGLWEISQTLEPIFGNNFPSGSRPILSLLVHQESRFIFETEISVPNDRGSAKRVLLQAIAKFRVLPKILIARDPALIENLAIWVKILGITIVRDKLKAIPAVLREMKREARLGQAAVTRVLGSMSEPTLKGDLKDLSK